MSSREGGGFYSAWVCNFSFRFDWLLHRLQVAGEYASFWWVPRNRVLTSSGGHDLCTARWRGGLRLIHGRYWIRYYPWMDWKFNYDLWNYFQSGKFVTIIVMEDYTATDGGTYTLLSMKESSVNKRDKLHDVIMNPWITMGISTKVRWSLTRKKNIFRRDTCQPHQIYLQTLICHVNILALNFCIHVSAPHIQLKLVTHSRDIMQMASRLPYQSSFLGTATVVLIRWIVLDEK